jgi:protein-disulfide isomerase/uncharacterized membrane protein
MARTRIIAAVLLCLAGGALSLLLLSKHYGVPLLGEAALAACGVGEGCDVVSQSRYAVFLGVPLAGWGLLLYGSLFALLAPSLAGTPGETRDPLPSLAFLLVATAVVIDVVLLGLQVAVIKAFCKFCLATYAVNLLLLAVLWPARSLAETRNAWTTPAARRGFLAWIVASLAVAAATVALNSGLADRKALAGTSILGTPPLLQAPKAAAPGSVEERLLEAQAEARKWKETLDDDRKLQIYRNQKARDDFNAAEVAKIDLLRSPTEGPSAAPIAVVTYSDFMCPFCRDLALGLRSFMPNAGGQIRVHYKFFPLDTTCNVKVGQSLHPGACELALGGICAQENGRFWEFHDKVFAQRWDRATRDDVLRIGASVGLDSQKLGACMSAAATKGVLAKDIDEGWRHGVGSTPTIFVNGRKLSSTSVFLIALEEERKRLGLPAPTGPAPPRQEAGEKKP